METAGVSFTRWERIRDSRPHVARSLGNVYEALARERRLIAEGDPRLSARGLGKSGLPPDNLSPAILGVNMLHSAMIYQNSRSQNFSSDVHVDRVVDCWRRMHWYDDPKEMSLNDMSYCVEEIAWLFFPSMRIHRSVQGLNWALPITEKTVTPYHHQMKMVAVPRARPEQSSTFVVAWVHSAARVMLLGDAKNASRLRLVPFRESHDGEWRTVALYLDGEWLNIVEVLHFTSLSAP